ncbi:MAG: HEPN domain-containing protein [Deltaproteobacteria bacterium]|nr:HEPN domain-containing protein [Deltaproteobacteria bacterium]
MPIPPPSTGKEQFKLAILLKDAILKSYDPEAIILFGSLGRGDADEFSDVDLFLIMETRRDVNGLGTEISDYLNPITDHKHIIVRTPYDVFRQQDVPGTIVFSAMQEGYTLFQKATWKWHKSRIDTYNERKFEVIRQEYIQTAHEFLSQAEASLLKGSFFRCRDQMRFAAIKAIKGIFVKHDIHPPRDTDLISLINQTKDLEPKLEKDVEFLQELSDYIPINNGPSAGHKSSKMLQKTTRFVIDLFTIYGTGPR